VTRSFVIMTTAPNAEMAELHDRMPVILEEQDWPMLLGEVEGDHVALMRPAPDGVAAHLADRSARRLATEQRSGVAGEHRRLV
jgi:putative SOS response-associated peptidase YedK